MTYLGGSGEQEAQGEFELLRAASKGGAKGKRDSAEELDNMGSGL